MVAVRPDTRPHFRNGSSAGTPHHMEGPDASYVAGYVIRLSDNGLTGFVYDRTGDPLDPASYTTQDLSAIAAVQSGLGLVDPGNGVLGIYVEDDHYAPAAGVDDQGRLWLAGNGHADPMRVVFSNQVGGVPNLASWNTLSYGAMPWAASGGNAHTYNQFNRMSDGRLLWFFDQQESATLSRGRDILGYYLPLGRTVGQIQAGGTSGWRPIVDTATGTGAWTGATPGSSRGELITTENVANSPAGLTGDPNDAGPANRVYINGTFVERRPSGDRLHVTFTWRTHDFEDDSSQKPGYAYTDSIGLNTLGSWRSAAGAVVPMPIHWQNRSLFTITDTVPPRTDGPGWLAVTADGRPVVVFENGVNGHAPAAGYGRWIRAEWSGSAWTFVNLGDDTQGHPFLPKLVTAGPGRGQYTVTTGSNVVRMRDQGGQIGASVTNGQDPAGFPWPAADHITPWLGTVAYGSQVANYAEAFHAIPDPVALSRAGRLDLLIPDGDDPRVYTLLDHARMAAS